MDLSFAGPCAALATIQLGFPPLMYTEVCYHLPLTTHCLLLTTYHPPPTTHHFYHLPPTTHHLLLTAHGSPTY